MDPSFKVSVIVPTYNGGSKIGFLLDSLLKQSCGNFELIVVIDGSTDNTREVLTSYGERFSCLQVESQKNQGRSIAKNRGAKLAQGDLLIFYDDDMIPPPTSIEQHIDFHKHHFGLLCGDVIEVAGNQRSDLQNYKAWLTAKWTGKYGDGITRMSEEGLFFTSANCSIPKKLFWQLNGFNPGLTDAEDYDLASRALQSGISVFFDKRNKAIHNEEITCKSYIVRLREYSAAQQRSHVYFFPSVRKQRSKFRILKRIIYRGFAFNFWVRMIDTGVLASLLPRRLRYRIYSTIIQALAYEHREVRL